MATPVKLDFMRHNFTAPGCEDLPAHLDVADGQKRITTAWQLDAEEHASVCACGIVMIQCLNGQPPMHVLAPAIAQGPETMFTVEWEEPSGEVGILPTTTRLAVPKVTDVLTLVMNALVKGFGNVRIGRL